MNITNNYNESLWYDKNGNIEKLTRFGQNDFGMPIPLDDLIYQYKNNNQSNILTRVTETNLGNPAAGFIDGTNTGDDYQYDEFGNMLSDENKGITSIEYNHLNLPRRINFATGGNIIYIYNAQGVKLQKTVSHPNDTQAITRYRGGFQYDNQTLQFVHTAEGYAKHTANPSNPTAYGAFDYVYNYTDHLGNIRLSYVLDPSGEGLKVMEENHYYPFGLKHSYNLLKRDIGYFDHLFLDATLDPDQDIRKTRMVSNNGYQYKYNGKEYQDELGLNMYDYGARVYDPAAPRFWQIDPHAETYFSLSPYNYVAGNPVSYTDPDGKDILFYVWEKNAKDEWVSKQVSFKQLDPGLQKALESFAKTDVGYSFFEGFAKKGDKIGGVSFNKDGKDSKHDLAIGQFYEQGAALGTSSVREGKDNIVFDMKLNIGRDTEVDNLESLTLTTGHEAFLHMNLYKDNIISAHNKGDKNEVNSIIAIDRENGRNGNGKKDHQAYLHFNPLYKKFNTFVTQLKTVLNPAKVNEAKKQHDEKLRKTTN
jgi:RHS repeat-associated protein